MQNSDEFERFMQELYEKFHRHDLKQADRLHRYRNIEPESGQFLSMLIRAQQSKSILEIGTSTGYSTLWLAEAARQTQAMITTLEVDAERVAQAKQYATEIDLADLINFKVIDAQVYLKEEQEIFDFILLDAERDAYVSYWPHLSRLLKAKGGLLVVDNVISHTAEVEEFIALIQQDPRFIMSIVPIGAGLLMVGFR
ncbi:O-methyltransferase [Acinetobacter sp. YH16052]|uniref:O-methyltransferase n=1 Tax=Acinetobacter sp. YH16052 TaxID=2601191 RepID=UPI0015D1581C|nr:class I SAM-dependent methyltransferase [Acinetobacter sp. YH16052]